MAVILFYRISLKKTHENLYVVRIDLFFFPGSDWIANMGDFALWRTMWKDNVQQGAARLYRLIKSVEDLNLFKPAKRTDH